jgi:hypothetical protein
LYNNEGEKVASLGEKALTNRDVTLPNMEMHPNPITFDEDGNVSAITLQLHKVDKENGGTVPDKQITVQFKDKDKALDYAIQLRAEQVGEVPSQDFDVVFKDIERQVSEEVLKSDKNKPAAETTVDNEGQPITADTGTTAEGSTPIPSNEEVSEKPITEETVSSDVGETKPLTAEPTIPVLEGGEGAPPSGGEPVKVKVGGEGEVGVTHAALDKLAEELGLPDRYSQKPETVEEWDTQAKERIAKGEMPKLIEKLEKDPSDSDHIDQRMILHYVAGLKAEYDATGNKALLADYLRIKRLNDAVGQDWGKKGRARQDTMLPHPLEGGLLSAMAEKAEAAGVGAEGLTPTQEAQVKKLVQEYKDAADKEKSAREDIEKKYNDFLAKQEVEGVKAETKSKPRKAKTKEDFAKERADLVKSMKDKWKNAGRDTLS